MHGRLTVLPRTLALVVGLVLPTACTTVMQQGPGAGVVPQLSLERFLDAANARDLQSMGRLFGTADGAAMDTGGTFGCFFKKIGSWFGGLPCVDKSNVEIRMAAISDIIKHDDYRVVRQETVAGRGRDAVQIWVDFTVNGENVTAVPFVVVRAAGGQWLVERIDLERLMARPGRGN